MYSSSVTKPVAATAAAFASVAAPCRILRLCGCLSGTIYAAQLYYLSVFSRVYCCPSRRCMSNTALAASTAAAGAPAAAAQPPEQQQPQLHPTASAAAQASVASASASLAPALMPCWSSRSLAHSIGQPKGQLPLCARVTNRLALRCAAQKLLFTISTDFPTVWECVIFQSRILQITGECPNGEPTICHALWGANFPFFICGSRVHLKSTPVRLLMCKEWHAKQTCVHIESVSTSDTPDELGEWCNCRLCS